MYTYTHIYIFSRRNQHRARELCQRVFVSRMASRSCGTAKNSALFGALVMLWGASFGPRTSKIAHRWPHELKRSRSS